MASTVDRFMVRSVVSGDASMSLEQVERLLEANHISSVPLVENGVPIGVVSRTDLLRAGMRESASHGDAAVPLPPRTAGEVATKPAIFVTSDALVSAAAARMVKERIHRVFVVDTAGSLEGVLSTKDLLAAIAKDRVEIPIGDVMSQPAFTIPVLATLGQAAHRLESAHVSGLVVVDEDGWPVGIYSQTEALHSRHLPADTSIEDGMNFALVCLHRRAPLHRAASLAHAARARRVLVIDERRVVGVVTPLDFARAVSA